MKKRSEIIILNNISTSNNGKSNNISSNSNSANEKFKQNNKIKIFKNQKCKRILKAKKEIFVIIVFFIILSVCYMHNIIQKNNSQDILKESKVESSTQYVRHDAKYSIRYYTNNYNNIDANIEKRYIMHNANNIIIGANKNEIENGFIDVKVEYVDENKIEIYVNKLFKEFNKDTLLDESYCYEIIDYIIKILDLDVERERLYGIISTNYEFVKNIDKIEELNKSIYLKDYIILVHEKDNMLVIGIC